jgi:hypothetical protein
MEMDLPYDDELDSKHVVPAVSTDENMFMGLLPLPPRPPAVPLVRSRSRLPRHARNPALSVDDFDYEAADRAGYDVFDEISYDSIEDPQFLETLQLSRAEYLSQNRL